jgi:hypothetical protein
VIGDASDIKVRLECVALHADIWMRESLPLNGVREVRGTRLVVQSLCGLGVGGSWFIVGRID